MSDHYRNALQSIVSDYAHMEGGTDRTDYYASIALAALNTPPSTALQADRGAVAINYSTLADYANWHDVDYNELCRVVRESLSKPTDEAPAKCDDVGAALERAAKELPERYELTVHIEQGAGTVTLFHNDDGPTDFEISHDDKLAGAINDAVDAALAEVSP